MCIQQQLQAAGPALLASRRSGKRPKTNRPGEKRRAIVGAEDGAPFLLGDIFPNPFFSVATIPFLLLQGGYVKLELCDERRRPIYTLADKIMDAGDYKVVVVKESCGLRSGWYHYQLSLENINGTFRQHKRMYVQ
jgi:hypothetical protein